MLKIAVNLRSKLIAKQTITISKSISVTRFPNICQLRTCKYNTYFNYSIHNIYHEGMNLLTCNMPQVYSYS